MRSSAWYALLLIAVLGFGVAGLISVVLVAAVGWLGVLLIGLGICFVAVRAELDADAPLASVALLQRQYERNSEERSEERLARWAERLERNKWLYVARTIGIATSLIGLNMFIVHQL
jgi:hypothetical protein